MVDPWLNPNFLSGKINVSMELTPWSTSIPFGAEIAICLSLQPSIIFTVNISSCFWLWESKKHFYLAQIPTRYLKLSTNESISSHTGKFEDYPLIRNMSMHPSPPKDTWTHTWRHEGRKWGILLSVKQLNKSNCREMLQTDSYRSVHKTFSPTHCMEKEFCGCQPSIERISYKTFSLQHK